MSDDLRVATGQGQKTGKVKTVIRTIKTAKEIREEVIGIKRVIRKVGRKFHMTPHVRLSVGMPQHWQVRVAYVRTHMRFQT